MLAGWREEVGCREVGCREEVGCRGGKPGEAAREFHSSLLGKGERWCSEGRAEVCLGGHWGPRLPCRLGAVRPPGGQSWWGAPLLLELPGQITSCLCCLGGSGGQARPCSSLRVTLLSMLSLEAGLSLPRHSSCRDTRSVSREISSCMFHRAE